jgi:sulfatase modifying factor 1
MVGERAVMQRSSRSHVCGSTVATVLGCALGFSACSSDPTPRDQWTIWIATDAPSPALVDRGLIEIVDDQGELACEDCRRQVGLPTDPSGWPFSFGMLPPASAATANKTLHVRVRLYRAQRSGADGFPLTFTAIDRVGALPPARGNTDVTVAIHAECIGLVASPAAHETCNGPEREMTAEVVLPTGRPAPTFVPGSWSRSVHRPCSAEAPEGMVCHPGGFLILGDAVAAVAIDTPPRPERYVTIAPFALDIEETTVGTVRALVKAGRITPPKVRDFNSQLRDGACSFLGNDNAANDKLPINCMTHDQAAAACKLRGARLPTEVEWEWAAGNLERETFYPWGERGDPCDYADVGLGRYTYEGGLVESSLCRARPGKQTQPSGLPKTPNPRDVTTLGIRALGGGVSEWVIDRLNGYDAPCWSPAEVFLESPRCESGKLFTLRGSAWSDTPGFSTSLERQGAGPTFSAPNVGFRCAISLE